MNRRTAVYGPVIRHLHWKTGTRLKTYTGETIAVRGALQVNVSHNAQEARLELLVVAGSGPSLMGRDWLHAINLDWSRIHQLRTSARLQEVLDRHSAVFTDTLGKVQGYCAAIHADQQATPVFCKPRTIPYALRPKV